MRHCSWLVAVLCLGILAGCQAARFQDALLEMMPRDEAGSQSLLSVLRGRSHHGRSGKSDKEDKTAYAAIKFIVPPSESDKFEEEWMKLQKTVMKEEEVDVFSLKKTMLDNLIYWSYGEWDSMRDLRDHFFSRHFEDFSDFVDDRDIKWELRFLENMSEDIERSQRKGRRTATTPVKHHHEEEDEDKDAHVLIHYYVPPGESDGFVEAWTDAAEKTIDEKGNYLYSLRKVATDNTRFWVYGSWDSMEDYLDHLNSKHLGKLLDYVADKDIYWHSEPLEDVSNDEDDHKHDDDDDDDDDLKRSQKKN